MKGVVKHKGQVSCRMLSFLSFFSELSYAELHATFPYYFFSFRFLVYFRLFFLEKDRDRTIVYLYDPFHGQSMRIDTRIQTRAYPFSNISLRWFSIINSPIIVSLIFFFFFFFFSYPFREFYSPIGMYIYVYIYIYIHIYTGVYICNLSSQENTLYSSIIIIIIIIEILSFSCDS